MNNTEERNELANEELLNKILEVSVGEEEDKTDVQDVDVVDQCPSDEEEVPPTPEPNPKEDKKRKKEEEKSFKMRRLLRKALRDEKSEGGSLKDMFNDMQISGEWLKRHWSFLLIVFACMLLFVTNRYQAQQEIIEEASLKQELNDWKYIWLTQFSELTRSSRQSYIEESLRQRGDSTLKPSKVAPFIIKVDNKSKNNGKEQ